LVSTVRPVADAEFLQAVAREVGDAADGHQHGVEGDAHVAAVVLGDQDLLAVLDDELLRLVPTSTSMPSARKRRVTSSDTSGLRAS
jgi:hypothetical protein